MEIVIYVPIIVLITIIPITIAGLGTREAATIFFFSKYATSESLLSVGILLSFIIVILPSLIGLLFMKKFYSRLIENGRRNINTTKS